MVKKTKPVTREELRWLKRNWTPGDGHPFRHWVAGSDHAHKIVKQLIEEALER